jgi:tRNA nucleotidyltransferase (CCA-adding enzyme)
LVCLADCLGRTIKDKEKCPKAINWVLEKAKELDIHNVPIKSLVQGKDLIELGFKPSKEFKEILDFAFDLQLDFHLEKEDIIKEIREKFL